MRRRNIELKKAILSRMDEKDYNVMVKILADDIYNKVEYDVIIQLARKCSNLHSAMLPLVREERDGLIEEKHQQLVKEQGGREPIRLTDRAIDWVIWSICRDAKNQSIKIRKILLVDDIIIHGTTLLRIKRKLKQAFDEMGISDYKIDIVTLAVNTEGLLINEEEISDFSDIRKCTISEWKPFSRQIVDTIYQMGETYTSYVPKMSFPMDSEAGRKIRAFIDREGLPQIDPEREDLGVKSYVCVVEGQEQYKLCESYRIYEFPYHQKYVFVPMVTLRAVDEQCLEQYIDSLLSFGVIVQNKELEQDSLREFLSSCSGEYKYRLVLYVASAFAGWKFLRDRVGVTDENSYDQEVEELNFYFCGLKSFRQLDEEQVGFSVLSEELEKAYLAMSPLEAGDNGYMADAIQDEAVKELSDALEGIIRDSGERKMDHDLIGKLLTVNNRIDEERYRGPIKKDEGNMQDRVMGLPLIDIVKMLLDIGGMTLAAVFMSVFRAIDYGRGSIVAQCFTQLTANQTERKWYTSLVHAGEENYRYYITYYLPVLYGLCMLEFRNQAVGADKKDKYWEEFYKQNPDMKYLDQDREYLVKTRTLQELKDVTEEAALYQPMNQQEKNALNSAIMIAKEYIK